MAQGRIKGSNLDYGHHDHHDLEAAMIAMTRKSMSLLHLKPVISLSRLSRKVSSLVLEFFLSVFSAIGTALPK